MKLLARRFTGGDWLRLRSVAMRTPTSTSASTLRIIVCWAVALVSLAVMFLGWPYQSGDFGIGRISVLGGWWRWLMRDPTGEWVFCPFVPVVSLVIAWRHRQELKKLPLAGHYLGLVLLAIACFSFWIGYKADTMYPGFAAFQLMVAALVLWFCGWRWMRLLLFPLMFLAFMWPIVPLEDQLANPMRRGTASAASGVLSLIGVPNNREGTTLISAGDPATGLAEGDRFKLDVELPCSGIRSLYSLLMLAALYGYVFLNGWKPRLVLFLSALPLAMLGNLVRMVMLALASIWFGSDFAIGKTRTDGEFSISGFHELAGFVVFAVALAGIFAIASFLEGVPWKKATTSASKRVPDDRHVQNGAPPLWLSAGAVVVLVGALLTVCAWLSGQPPLSPPGVRVPLPMNISSAVGQEIPMTAQERNALQNDVSISRRVYFSSDGKPLLATVVLSGESRRGLHRPDVCLPSQGWVISDQSSITVKLNDGRDIDAMLMRVFKDVRDPKTGVASRERGMNIYWFQGYDGVHTSDYYGHVARSYFDAVFKNLNHRWALVSFFTQVNESTAGVYDAITEAAAVGELQAFVGDIGAAIVKKPGEE